MVIHGYFSDSDGWTTGRNRATAFVVIYEAASCNLLDPRNLSRSWLMLMFEPEA
jgi:hypothetical protein